MNYFSSRISRRAMVIGVGMFVAAGFFLVVTPVSAQIRAQVGVDAQVNVNVPKLNSTSSERDNAQAKVLTARLEKAHQRAAQEIDRRIEGLTKLIARVKEMEKVSDTSKASLTLTIQNEISSLVALKAKIAANSDLESLKTDIQSITKGYRIYALVIPQGHILASADRIMTLATSSRALATKLEARVVAAETAGKNVATLKTALADIRAKAALAEVDAQAAIALTVALTPDNGDKAKAEANRTALMSARAKIKSGTEALKAARKSAESIVKELKSFKLEGTATSSAAIKRQ